MPKLIIKDIDKKKSIGQAAKDLDVQTHVIRFWETKFKEIKPFIGKGDRRYFFDKDIEVLKKIKYYLYEEGYTIPGLQKFFANKHKLTTKYSSEVSDSNADIQSEKKIKLGNAIKNIEMKLEKLEKLLNNTNYNQ